MNAVCKQAPTHHQQKNKSKSPRCREWRREWYIEKKELNLDFSEGTDIGVTLIVEVSELVTVVLASAEVFVLTVR